MAVHLKQGNFYSAYMQSFPPSCSADLCRRDGEGNKEGSYYSPVSAGLSVRYRSVSLQFSTGKPVSGAGLQSVARVVLLATVPMKKVGFETGLSE